MHFLAFGLIIGLGLAQNTTASDCGGCVVHGYPAGLLWADVREFLNETVYLEIDQSDNSTRTIKTEANTAAASSFSSLCNEAYESITKDYGYPDGTGVDACFSNGIATQTFTAGSQQHTAERYVRMQSRLFMCLPFHRVYPTTYIMFSSLDIVFSSMTTVSGIKTCTESHSSVTSWFDYALTGDDTTVLSTFTNDGHIITWEGMPHGLLTAIPGLSKCTPGTGQGVPVSKIPVVGTASTVYQYKSKTKQQPSKSSTPEPGSSPPVTTVDPTESAHPPKTSAVSEPSSPSSSNEVNPPATSTLSQVNPPATSTPGQVNPPVQTTIITTKPSQKESLALTAPAIVIGTETIVLAPTASGSAIPEGYSLLPSGSGVVLPNGNTLLPGTVTTIDGVPVSVAPSGGGEATANGTAVQSTTSSVTDSSQSAAEGKRTMLRALASLAGVGFTIILLA